MSLLCPAVKTLESLLLPSITQHPPPATHQHGFRPGHSTVSALLHLSSSIADGFNQKPPANRTVAVALDLTKAFDTVDHTILIERIRSSNMLGYLTRWLSCYLRGRQARTIFRGHTSTTRMIHTGVPQGSVILPALFNAYISDLTSPPADVKLVSYADDTTVYTSGPTIPPLTNKLNGYLEQLSKFLSDRSFTLSTSKSIRYTVLSKYTWS